MAPKGTTRISNVPTNKIRNLAEFSRANLIIGYYEDPKPEIKLLKNRYGEPGIIDLPVAIDLLAHKYFNSYKLTFSKMFNEPIKEELEEAIYKVLEKHGLT